MAPLPDNSTGRYYVDYTYDGNERTTQFRFQSPNDIVSVRFHVGAFLNALRPMMEDNWAITGARLASAGSDFSVPTPPPTLNAGTRGGNLPPVNAPQYTSFIGRGQVSARRVRIFVYGLVFTVDSDYRAQLPLAAPIAAALAALRAGADDGVFVTVANDIPLWYDYVNQGFNAYWQRAARRS